MTKVPPPSPVQQNLPMSSTPSSSPTPKPVPANKSAASSYSGISMITNDDPKPTGEKVILIGIEGFGKTTTGCYAPDANIMMSPLETGYFKLREAGRVPKVPYAVCKTWKDGIGLLDHYIKNGGPKWLVIDAINGFERLCHEMVCERDFKNDRTAFTSFHKGYDVAVTDWQTFLGKLEALASNGTNIIALCHYQIRDTPNPMGADFQQFIPDLHKYTWSITNRWADDVLFGTFFTVTQKVEGEIKGIGGQDRVVYASHFDAVNAKNKWGMEPMIMLPADPSQMFNSIFGAMHK